MKQRGFGCFLVAEGMAKKRSASVAGRACSSRHGLKEERRLTSHGHKNLEIKRIRRVRRRR